MIKPFAVLIALAVVLGALALSFVFLWGITKQVLLVARKNHVAALRTNANHLEKAGYLEAAEHFRNYADALESPSAEVQKAAS